MADELGTGTHGRVVDERSNTASYVRQGPVPLSASQRRKERDVVTGAVWSLGNSAGIVVDHGCGCRQFVLANIGGLALSLESYRHPKLLAVKIWRRLSSDSSIEGGSCIG